MNTITVNPQTNAKQNQLNRIPGSVVAWLALVAYLIAVKFILTLLLAQTAI